MIEEIKNIQKSKNDLKKFGLTLGLILLIASAYSLWKEYDIYPYFAIAGMLLILCGIFAPKILKPLYWTWMTVANMLGWFMTRIILILIFYILITPIGLISRFIGKKFLEKNWNNKQNSYWNRREEKILQKQRYENQY